MAEDSKIFAGEEESAGFAAPALDLIASVALVALSVWVMIEAIGMRRPAGLTTAPGLLPFVVAASLCLMAIALAVFALRRRRLGLSIGMPEDMAAVGRTVFLVVLIGIYIAAIHVLSFEYAVSLGETRLEAGSFELISIVFLTIVLLAFWGAALWQCFLVSVVWIGFLAAVFRYVFVIPLPG
ncbi:MAG: hypothetical protein AAF414_18485 [Pseudomonadota bacterium]